MSETIARLRRNGNAIGGWFVEVGYWMPRPLGPTQRPRRFMSFTQRHFHKRQDAAACLAEERAKVVAKGA